MRFLLANDMCIYLIQIRAKIVRQLAKLIRQLNIHITEIESLLNRLHPRIIHYTAPASMDIPLSTA